MSETPAYTPTPPSVFFSYSRADSSTVERLRTNLGPQAITTWVDREGIRPGTPDSEKIPTNGHSGRRRSSTCRFSQR